MPREAVTTCAARDQPRRAVRRPDAGRLRGDRAAGALDHRGREGGMSPGLDHVLSRNLGRHPRRQPRRLRRPPAGHHQAVHRINADKRRYVSYFKRDWAGHPEVDALSPDDFNLGRIQVKEPGPIPESEARWAWEWMASWGLIEGTFDVTAQIDRGLERKRTSSPRPSAPGRGVHADDGRLRRYSYAPRGAKLQEHAGARSLVRRIIEAGRLTGSGMNGQPWHFIVMRDAETLRRLGALASSGSYVARPPWPSSWRRTSPDSPSRMRAGRSSPCC